MARLAACRAVRGSAGAGSLLYSRRHVDLKRVTSALCTAAR
ncbi:putative leader peptide [Frankia sp. AgB32]